MTKERLTQNSLAEAIGMGQPYINLVLNGKLNVPDKYIIPFCTAYNVNLYYITQGKTPMMGRTSARLTDIHMIWKAIDDLRREVKTIKQSLRDA